MGSEYWKVIPTLHWIAIRNKSLHPDKFQEFGRTYWKRSHEVLKSLSRKGSVDYKIMKTFFWNIRLRCVINAVFPQYKLIRTLIFTLFVGDNLWNNSYKIYATNKI